MAPTPASVSTFYQQRKTRSQNLVDGKDRGKAVKTTNETLDKNSSANSSAIKQTESLDHIKEHDGETEEEIALLQQGDNIAGDVSTSAPTTPMKRRQNKSSQVTEPCSPPKISCPESAATPSTLLKELKIVSPAATLERRSALPVKPVSSEPDDLLAKARTALHTHAQSSLPGREKELKFLNDYIQDHLNNRKSGSLYISGPPGTGKTACLSQVLEQPHLKQQFKIVSVNCASFKSPKVIHHRIAEQLSLHLLKKSGKAYTTGKAYQEKIEKCLRTSHEMILMVLDEMDQLDTKNQSVLYTIFEWPLNYPSGIILIGIANALDLTDRLLPRLKAKSRLAPELLHFAPYTKQQLIDIYSHRLGEAGATLAFHPAALQLLASKLSAVNGDARRALDIARRAVEKECEKVISAKMNAAQTPSKELMAVPLISDPSPVRKSPRKAVGTVPYQHPYLAKKDNCVSVARTKSPLKTQPPLQSPQKCSFISPQNSSPKTPADNSSLKENCSPTKPKSARKLFKDCGASSKPPANRNLNDTLTSKEPSIGIMSVMNIVNEVYGTSQGIGKATDSGEELPLHQKLAVCSLLLIRREGKNKEITVGKLHDVYRRVCIKRHMEPLDSSAFLSMLGLVEARGILLLPGRGKKSRLTKVDFNWIEDEVVSALQDRELLAAILRDKSCLS